MSRYPVRNIKLIDGLCDCDCGDICPVFPNKTGMSHKCSKFQLDHAGIEYEIMNEKYPKVYVATEVGDRKEIMGCHDCGGQFFYLPWHKERNPDFLMIQCDKCGKELCINDNSYGMENNPRLGAPMIGTPIIYTDPNPGEQAAAALKPLFKLFDKVDKLESEVRKMREFMTYDRMEMEKSSHP